MKPRVFVNNTDISDSVLFDSLAIHQDSTSRIDTAEFTVRFAGEPARWDDARWDVDRWSVGVNEFAPVAIYDIAPAPDVQKFGGWVTYFSFERAAPTVVFLHCQCQGHGIWLENIVVPHEDLGASHSDQYILQYLINKYAAGRLSAAGVQQILPVCPIGLVENQTLRQVLDWVTDLSNAHWHVSADGTLVYHSASAQASSYSLSDTPDGVTKFAFNITDFSKDFARPINHSIISGAVLANGSYLQVEYEDPQSVSQYGRFSTTTLDRQLYDANEARLRAEAIVDANAFPKESGSLVTYADVFNVGDYVQIDSDVYLIFGNYVLHRCDIKQLNRTVTEYSYGFGPKPPDAERLLRQLERWMRTESGAGTMQGIPAPGSVSEGSLAPGFKLQGSQIAGTISGSNVQIDAGTLYGVISGAAVQVTGANIIGTISGSNVTVSAGTIEGVIQGPNVQVQAANIYGVVVSSQLADQIINDLAKYADALRPIPILDTPPTLPNKNNPPNSFWNWSVNNRFYKISADGLGYSDAGNNPDLVGSMKLYHIGKLNAANITGLILAAQIDSISAGKITGQIQANQIGQVNASAIVGSITAGQSVTISTGVLQGTITGPSVAVSATTISGLLQAGQIGSMNATNITLGLLDTDNRISRISGGKLDAGTVNTAKLDATEIACGGGGGKPGRIGVYNASNQMIGFIGTFSGTEGGWFKTLGVGGTQASPVIKADSAGAVSITNADFTINGGSNGYVEIKSTTFNSDYASVGVNVHDAANAYKCWHVSRGVVGYNGSQSVFSLNVSPGAAAAGECVIYSSGSIIIWLDGATGTVRASKFQVGGTPGFNGTIPAGRAITVTNGIVTSFT